ncbi:hypothetical protein [Robertkochia aurantiaca]|uniref:hypothetical protein n=1 Tax=Robertkochia aurantiaca TaxID=2873700 RepID=UPI001CC97A58|nr:hypothetical protein [Robertkochia sp. 3YJGBD-33]
MLFSLILTACSSDNFGEIYDAEDQNAGLPYYGELLQLQAHYSDLPDPADCEKLGYDLQNSESPIAANLVKMQNTDLVDNVFDLLNPEEIIYIRESDGSLTFAGVSYLVKEFSSDGGVNGAYTPPQGFTGDHDAWRFDGTLSAYRLNVWIGIDNPEGVFAWNAPASSSNTTMIP